MLWQARKLLTSIYIVSGDSDSTGCIISEYDHYGSPEKECWDMKYCCQKWTPQIL